MFEHVLGVDLHDLDERVDAVVLQVVALAREELRHGRRSRFKQVLVRVDRRDRLNALVGDGVADVDACVV